MSLPTRPILVCDDEAPIRQIIAAKLRSAGFTILEARNGLECYGYVDPSVLPAGMSARAPQPIVPAMVLTDLQMPMLSGLELATKLRDNPLTATVPVIMLTARGYALTQDQLAMTNIKHLMPKPFGVKQLLDLVHQTLGIRRDAQPTQQAA